MLRPLSSGRHAALACLLLASLTLLAASPALAGGDPRLVVDELNELALTLGPDWYASVPVAADASVGAMTLTNYREADLPEGTAQEHDFPAGTVKIDIRTAPREAREDLGGLKARRAHQLSEEPSLWIGDAIETRVAGRDAVAYLVAPEVAPASANLDLLWDEETIVHVSITPATSAALDEALEVVDRLRERSKAVAADDTAHGTAALALTNLKGATAEARTASLASEIARLVDELPIVAPEKIASCPAGTFAGTEAPQISGGVLTMPFLVESGYYWEVGEYGSFYGNGAHCNGNADYYATDWNRYSDSNCTVDAGDGGQPVYPVYGGTVRQAGWDSTGYGYEVEIEHTIGGTSYLSRYAHLQNLSIAVSPGQSVTTSTFLGRVGNTGGSIGDHLHLSWQQLSGGVYQSRCWNNGATCPNGESPWNPQTAKPSPMSTHLGNVNLVDGGCYAATFGGGGTSTVITVDDSSAAFYGPSQYWYQVWGLGQNNQMHYTWNSQYSEGNYVYWNFTIPSSGNYKIEAFIPRNHATTTRAQYYLWNGSSWSFLTSVNQNNQYDAWVTLKSSVYLTPGTRRVKLTDVTLEPSGTRKVGFDAIRVTKQ